MRKNVTKCGKVLTGGCRLGHRRRLSLAHRSTRLAASIDAARSRETRHALWTAELAASRSLPLSHGLPLFASRPGRQARAGLAPALPRLFARGTPGRQNHPRPLTCSASELLSLVRPRRPQPAAPPPTAPARRATDAAFCQAKRRIRGCQENPRRGSNLLEHDKGRSGRTFPPCLGCSGRGVAFGVGDAPRGCGEDTPDRPSCYGPRGGPHTHPRRRRRLLRQRPGSISCTVRSR
jgi:hypothetical protein